MENTSQQKYFNKYIHSKINLKNLLKLFILMGVRKNYSANI